MTKELTFTGHSDDIFEAAGDEYYSPFVAKVTADDGSLVVRAFYGEGDHNEGVWCIGIEPVGEEHQIPAWPVQIALADNGYSPTMILTVPDEATVTQCKGD